MQQRTGGWGAVPGTQGWSVRFELSGRARARAESLLASLASETDLQERLFKNARHKDSHPSDYVSRLLALPYLKAAFSSPKDAYLPPFEVLSL